MEQNFNNIILYNIILLIYFSIFLRFGVPPQKWGISKKKMTLMTMTLMTTFLMSKLLLNRFYTDYQMIIKYTIIIHLFLMCHNPPVPLQNPA